MNSNDDRGFLNVNRRIKSTCHLQKWNVFVFDLSLSLNVCLSLSLVCSPVFPRGGSWRKSWEMWRECIITAVSNRSWSSKKIWKKNYISERERGREGEKRKKCANLLRPAFSEQCFCCDLHNAKILDALVILFINHSMDMARSFIAKLIIAMGKVHDRRLTI